MQIHAKDLSALASVNCDKAPLFLRANSDRRKTSLSANEHGESEGQSERKSKKRENRKKKYERTDVKETPSAKYGRPSAADGADLRATTTRS